MAVVQAGWAWFEGARLGWLAQLVQEPPPEPGLEPVLLQVPELQPEPGQAAEEPAAQPSGLRSVAAEGLVRS